LGGAGKEKDLIEAYQRGYASALAAGSLFVYQGKKRGVLINYLDKNELTFE
jgi:cyclase